jgi:hypothetical protein
MCLRRIQGQWVFVVFNNFQYRIEVRVFPDITDDLYNVPMNVPIHGTDWGQEGGDAVAQLYGPSIVPGSRLDGGFHLFVSQWKAPGPWPYHVMQFKIPLPGVPPVAALAHAAGVPPVPGLAHAAGVPPVPALAPAAVPGTDSGRVRRSAAGNGQPQKAPARARVRRSATGAAQPQKAPARARARRSATGAAQPQKAPARARARR